MTTLKAVWSDFLSNLCMLNDSYFCMRIIKGIAVIFGQLSLIAIRMSYKKIIFIFKGAA